MPVRQILSAVDTEDLQVLSARVQDAIVTVGDIAYEPVRRRFAMLLNRYMWEADTDGRVGTRVQSGLHFEGVTAVQSRNIRRVRPDAFLNLLAVEFMPAAGAGEDPSGIVALTFSGGGAVRLEVECLDAQLRDIGTPWKATARPDHALSED